MTRWRRAGNLLKYCGTLYAFLSMAPISTYADTADALIAITSTADKICGIVATSGEFRSVKTTGEIKAELSGLARKLVDIGVSGARDINSTEYQGIVQAELPATLKDVRECKLKVFDVLQRKLLPDTAPNASTPPPVARPRTAEVHGDEGKVFLLREPMPLRRRPASYDDNPVAQLAVGDEVTVIHDDRSDGWKYVRDNRTHKEGFLPASAISSR